MPVGGVFNLSSALDSSKLKPNGLLIAICIVWLLVLLYTVRYTEVLMLAGFWKMDPEFCTTNGLNTAILYINVGGHLFSPISAYFIMQNSLGIILNDSAKISLDSWSIAPYVRSTFSTDVDIRWDSKEVYDHFPSKQSMECFPYLGKLKFTTKEGSISAIYYKDSDASDV